MQFYSNLISGRIYRSVFISLAPELGEVGIFNIPECLVCESRSRIWEREPQAYSRLRYVLVCSDNYRDCGLRGFNPFRVLLMGQWLVVPIELMAALGSPHLEVVLNINLVVGKPGYIYCINVLVAEDVGHLTRDGNLTCPYRDNSSLYG